MTARTFADEMGVNYRTALSWLRGGLVPGAEEKTSPVGTYWEIPDTALSMEKPKPGPKPKSESQSANGQAAKRTRTRKREK